MGVRWVKTGKTPATYEYNVDVTRRTVEMAHACGVSVEVSWVPGIAGDRHGGREDGYRRRRRAGSQPAADRSEEAADFVKKTGVDALQSPSAPRTAPGSSPSTDRDILAIERIKEIHARIPNTHLVMHGSSSVPQDWLAMINEYGGDMGETYGVPVEEIVEGIKHGVRKVNIDTDLRMASTGAVRKFLAENRRIRPA